MLFTMLIGSASDQALQEWAMFKAFLLCLLLVTSLAVEELPKNLDDPRIGSEKGVIHAIASSECGSNYLVYQAWAQKYTFDLVQQPGKYTRILSCNEPENIAKEDLEMMDTLVVPSWRENPTNDDYYPPYNKPVGIMYWLAERKPTAEWTLIVDPDMLFRQRFLLENFDVEDGYAFSSTYHYMIKVMTNLTERHIPNVLPRNDTYGGPVGRKADTSGAFYFLRTKELIRLAPLWLKYTEDVRMDPLAWKFTATGEPTPNEKVWIAEMYGYVYAAASIGLWHKTEPTIQTYPGYSVQDIPMLIHYGYNHTVLDYWFDKHSHLEFNPKQCPPWNMNFYRSTAEDAGLFPHPPDPAAIPDMPPREKYGQLLVIEVVNTFNRALCRRHKRVCLGSDQLQKECEKSDIIAKELQNEFEKLHLKDKICYDVGEECKKLATLGECLHQWTYINEFCRKSCNRCRTFAPPSVLPNNDTSLFRTVVQEVTRCQNLTPQELLSDHGCIDLIGQEAFKSNLSEMRIIPTSHTYSDTEFMELNFFNFTVFLILFVTVVLLIKNIYVRAVTKPTVKCN